MHRPRPIATTSPNAALPINMRPTPLWFVTITRWANHIDFIWDTQYNTNVLLKYIRKSY